MSQLADVLAGRGQELLRRWTERVRPHMSPSGGLPSEQMAPLLLQQLEALLRGGSSGARTPPATGPQGFSLEARVRGCELLRELLLDLMDEEGLQISTAELRRLNGFVSGAIAEALAEHGRLREENERLRAHVRGERSRLNAFFMHAPMCISIMRGPECVIELVNPPACRIWGRPPEQLLGRPLLEALPELRGFRFDALLRGVMATGKPFVARELPVQLAQGEGGALRTEYLTITYEALRDEHGGIDGVLIMAVEVTEVVRSRQAAEALLLQSQEAAQARAAVLDALAAQTLVAVSYQRGPELVFETANSVFRQIVGRDVVGLSMRQALPELTGSQELSTQLTRVRETGQPYVVREVLLPLTQGPGGPLREGLFDLTYQPVRAPDGSVDGVLTLLIEVTAQVQLRWDAQRLAEEERTRRGFEQHLIGIVSHDLRNPLGAILLSLQVLLRRPGLEARTTQSLERMRLSTERAVRLVRDLLDFTQARLGGGLKIDRVPMDLHAVARGVVEEFQVTHPGRELRLEQRGEGTGDWDSDRITQLLGNLLGNALKYSPTDSPVTVRSLGGFEQMRLEVHNEGRPIAPEALERIFQPLQRDVEGPGTDTAGRSVGLGLYIVEQIAQAHAGDIQVSSTGAEGTTFSVVLPRTV